MDINMECKRIFLNYNDLAKEWNRIGNAISQLSACVQNPDFICQADLDIFEKQCKMVSRNMTTTIMNTKSELNGLYKRVFEIYYDKLGE